METTLPAETPPPRLIFDGRAWNPSRWRLAWFLLLSLLGHTGVFYLFKVVTPQTTRRLPPEESVLVLRGSDPESSQILASLEDRSPAGMLVSLTPSDEKNLPKLALPDYTPSYHNYEPDYKLNWTPPLSPLPKLAEANRPLLPKRASAAKTLPAAPPQPAHPLPPEPQLVLPEFLAERGLATPPVWPKELLAPEEPSDPLIFHLAILPSGLVKYCLSEGQTPPPGLQQAMQQLRFNPLKSQLNGPAQWVDVEVHW